MLARKWAHAKNSEGNKMTTKIDKNLRDYKIILEILLQLGLKYQLAIKGPFNIAVSTAECEIDNEVMNQFGFEYVSSERYDYDGGIKMHFIFTHEVQQIVSKYLKQKKMATVIYNTDIIDEDLKYVLVNDPKDCEHIGIEFEIDNNDFDNFQLADELKTFWSSDSIASKRTFVALKFR